MKWLPWIAGLAAACLAGLFVMGRRAFARIEDVDSETVSPASGAKFIQTRSGRVHYLDIGEGPPVILLHGSGRSIADWREGAQLLSKQHRVIAFDFYGFGFSERNRHFSYGYDLWIQEAIDLLDALGIVHVTIVGHSVGGALACMVAATHPNRIDHVVTVGTGMAIEPAQFVPVIPGLGEFAMSRQSMFGPAVSEQNRAELEAAFRIRGTRAALLMYIRRQMTIDGLRLLRGVFEDVRAPVLHVSGSDDRNIPPRSAQELVLRTGGGFVLIQGATHMVHTDKPAELVATIESFLAST